MTKKLNERLAEIQENQDALRHSIEKSKELAAQSDRLIQLHKQKQNDGSVEA